MADFSKIFADYFKKRVRDLKVTEVEYDSRNNTVDVIFKSDSPKSKCALYRLARAMSKNHEYDVLSKLGLQHWRCKFIQGRRVCRQHRRYCL
jgi:hypothetical protein